MNKLSLKDLDLKGKKVLMRVDFNVPLDKRGNITDDTRIVASIPSIRYVMQQGGKLILMSHLGRPKGPDPKLSLRPCAEKLSQHLQKPVKMASESIGEEVEAMVADLKGGEVLLLENVRFHEGEEHPEKDPDYARKLSRWGDIYANDAFGTAHRDHASTCTLAKFFLNKSVAGFLLEKEIQFLGQAFQKPQHPFYAIIGGSKISSKIGVLKSLLAKADALLIGGAMSYTFYKAKGLEVGNSLYEKDYLETARTILREAEQKNIPVHLPLDNLVADNIENPTRMEVVESSKGIPAGMQGADIGPQTIEHYAKILQDAKMVFWNGPLGVFEREEFAHGTNAIAQVVADLQATTIVGGGDSIAALQKKGLINKISHASTGGGASLEYIEFGKLPGIEALSNKE